MSVCCECCLSGRDLCIGLITRPEESYRLWCVIVCDLETSWMRRPWPTGCCCAKRKKKIVTLNVQHGKVGWLVKCNLPETARQGPTVFPLQTGSFSYMYLKLRSSTLCNFSFKDRFTLYLGCVWDRFHCK